MRRGWAVLLVLAGCALAPEVLRQDIQTLEQLAVQAGEQHARQCTPDPPLAAEPPPEMPAVCAPLQECVKQLQTAAHTCQDAIDGAVEKMSSRAYTAMAGQCQSQRDEARMTCRAAGVVLPAARKGK